MYIYIHMHPYTDINNIELRDLKRLDKRDICSHDPRSVPDLAWFNSEGSGLHNLTTELASQRNAAMLWHGVSNSIRARWFCDQWTWSVWDGHPWRSVQCPRFQGVYGFCVFLFCYILSKLRLLSRSYCFCGFLCVFPRTFASSKVTCTLNIPSSNPERTKA